MLAGRKHIMRQMSAATLLSLIASITFSTATRAEEPLTITRLEMRDRVVLSASGTNGSQYSVITKNGIVLDAKLSEEQLAAKHPDVYEQVRPAFAGREANFDIIQWAGM